MMNDTVREEMQKNISPACETIRAEISPAQLPKPVESFSLPVTANPQISAMAAKSRMPPAAAKADTADLANKKTSPILVEFQNRNATVPDWRLQLQNSVRQRKSDVQGYAQNDFEPQIQNQKQLVTSGTNALKAQYVETPNPVAHENPTVANALRRIEDSRRAFMPAETIPAPEPQVKSGRNFPFNVVSRSGDIEQRRTESKATVNTVPKPRLVSSLRIEKKGFDTNKLPPIPQPLKPIETNNNPISASLKMPAASESMTAVIEKELLRSSEIFAEQDEGIDDLAQLSSRFNAGLFDMIIGAFATAILLSPALVSGVAWFSLSGTLALAAAFGIVMFVYLTASVGLRGKTLGMKLFSLEIADVEANEYPTMHQAAVSSAVYLLSLPLLGIGFVPAFLNEEKRAAHDILSGTIVLREMPEPLE